MKHLIEKLRTNSGDSIAEVLVATLVSALGALLFATMAMSSTKIAQIGIDKVAEYAEQETAMELQESSMATGVSIQLGGQNLTHSAGTVTIYGDSTERLFSYAKD
ncbi:MAG: hypothetical protein IJ225_10585 [Solobacterium sp.]|nr:hypothetical protein [Solobacterium sp.]